jgi:hypothetical protein
MTCLENMAISSKSNKSNKNMDSSKSMGSNKCGDSGKSLNSGGSDKREGGSGKTPVPIRKNMHKPTDKLRRGSSTKITPFEVVKEVDEDAFYETI